MPIPKILLSFVLITAVFFAIDLLWLGIIAKNFYARHLGSLMAEQVNWVAATVFYLLYIVGIMFFVVFPSVEKSSLLYAILAGGFLGLLCYGTYDLTNLATMRDFPLKVTIIDMIWGTVLTGSVSTAGYFIVRWLK